MADVNKEDGVSPERSLRGRHSLCSLGVGRDLKEEKRGLGISRTSLYQKMRCVVTHIPTSKTMSHDQWQRLQEFRQGVYQNLGRARDATFELMDAVMLSRKVDSLADLSLCPCFRRKWSSAYEALEDTRPNANQLMRLYLEQIPTESVVVMAGDHTPWPRPEAKSLKERTYQHRGGDPWSRRPVTVGQGYSTLAWIPESEGSWALPLRHERITSWETPLTKAAWQLGQVCKNLSVRPLTLWDSEYGCASFVLKTAHIRADKLMRLRSNRCVWGAPPAYGGRGRPRVHGEKFKRGRPNNLGSSSSGSRDG